MGVNGVRKAMIVALAMGGAGSASWTVAADEGPNEGLSPAEVDVHDDYLAILVEAEDHLGADARWVLTEPNTPEQDNDPDGNHSDLAAGNAYLELLPDWRVTHDSVIPDDAPPFFWGVPGNGPEADYRIDFPEAGRYHAHFRLYSTGTEDNGMHVGIDDTWPESGRRVQSCSAGRGWSWSSKQRGAGGSHCGVPKTIWLTVEEAGVHTVTITPREDGLEVDRFMLIKDRSDNTRVCGPLDSGAVTCRNGRIETADGFVDLDVAIVDAPETGTVGEEVELFATVRNADLFDTATAIELAIDVDSERWDVVALDSRCEAEASRVRCELDALAPSGPDDGERFRIVLEGKAEGVFGLEAGVTAAESDDGPDNDAARVDIQIDDPVVPTILSVYLEGLPGSVTVGERTTVVVRLANEGDAPALDARATLSVPEGFAVSGSSDCDAFAEGRVECLAPTLDAGGTVDLVFSLEAVEIGQVSVGALARAANADGGAAVRSVHVVEPAPVVVVEPPPVVVVTTDTSSGGGPEGGPDGGSDGGDDAEEPSLKIVLSANEGGGSATAAFLLTLLSIALTRSSGRASSRRVPVAVEETPA